MSDRRVGEPIDTDRLVVGADARLVEQTRVLAGRRMVFFVGIPGTGKSLLVHQLTHLAVRAGRTVHLLQWDVARPVLEGSPAGRRYPVVDGVTHAVIRKAAGLWARRAVVAWHERHPGPEHLLIGETPLVGGRFIELARPIDDDTERVLTAESCRFVIPVPSREVRRHLESERERRAARPLHPREHEDAPPQVLRDLWRELTDVAGRLGIGAAPDEYDPLVYRRVYETVLRHRNVDAIALDVILPTERLSVYDFAVETASLAPTEAEIPALIAAVERRYADPEALARETDRWWAP